jgi:hypothetical protein
VNKEQGHIPAEEQSRITASETGPSLKTGSKNMGQDNAGKTQENLENLPSAVSSGRALRARTGQRAVAARKRAKAQKAFLVLYGQCGVIGHAAKQVGVSRRTILPWREQDQAFNLACSKAEQEAADVLEREAYRRAVEGWDQPVYQRGEQVGVIRMYSERLLLALLAAKRPEFRTNTQVQVNVAARREEKPTMSVEQLRARVLALADRLAPKAVEGEVIKDKKAS